MRIGGWSIGSRRAALKTLQYAIGVGLLWWLVRTIQWGSLLETAARLSTWSLIVVLAASLAGMVAQFGTWHALAAPVSRYPISRIVQVDLVIRFVNSLLPSRVSGRSLAPIAVRHYLGASWADATAVAMVHTGLYALCYALVTVVGILVGRGLFPTRLLALLTLAGLLYLGTGALIVLAGIAPEPLLRVLGGIQSVGERVPVIGGKVAGWLDSLDGLVRNASSSFGRLVSAPLPVTGFVVGWIGAVVLFPSIRFGVLLSAFGLEFEPLILLPVYLITAYSVTVLPITPAGLGITEATATAVFVALGLSPEVAVATVLIDRLVGVYMPALAGWYPFVRTDLWSGVSTKNEGL